MHFFSSLDNLLKKEKSQPLHNLWKVIEAFQGEEGNLMNPLVP